MAEEAIQSPGVSLADEMYGTPEPAPEPTPDPTPEPVAEEPAAEDLAADEPASDEPSSDEPAAEEPASDELNENEIEVSSVEQLAEHFEFDPEWMTNLTMEQTVNGEKISVTLGDALATHRKVKSADAILSDAKEKRKAIQNEIGQDKELYTESIATVSALLQQVESELEADTKSIDWAALRRDDPAEYSARKDDVRDRQTRLDKLKSDAIEAVKGSVDKNDQARMQRKIDAMPEQNKIFLDRIPEWKDEKKQAEEREQFIKWIRNEGATDEQLQELSLDGKMMSFMVMAMRYDQSKTKSEAAKKKVVKVPKVMKPGAKSPAPKPNGKDDDAVSILYGPS